MCFLLESASDHSGSSEGRWRSAHDLQCGQEETGQVIIFLYLNPTGFVVFFCFFFSVVSLSLKFHVMFWHVVATRKIVHIFWHLKGKSRHVDNLVEIIFKLIGSHVSTEWTKAKLCGCVPFLLTFPCGEFFLSSLSRNFHFEEHAGKLQIKQL